MGMIVRCAQAEDTGKLITFLNEAKLGTDGVKEAIEYFLIMEDETSRIQATLGIEPLGRIGLLRSLAMTTNARENDLLIIFEQMLKLARSKELDHLYLATNKESSLPFFTLLGFERVEQNSLPSELFTSVHVNHILNVDNSMFLKLKL
ncbi:GNAT family N-acetyltransferase [Robertmurraya andreesenii]|uniref:N-acetylglutamate synthase-like GNAT family acetyltransferase n=1 Tax=Anoxybacillus andreesenii TaxID=1325932 RepID=A0ABT9V094_9BACL|nr:hypothetical protein [Robertmurraya andreesenii]MDQ0154320.1 N-acetylglutamate synthase-like GNAT family acetyltransferase [Robertmurraya andreesenii]